MILDKNVGIKLNSMEYEQLSLNEKIAVFNREVHTFEDQQYQEIISSWKKINDECINTEALTVLRKEQIKNSLAQALINLKKMLEAQTLYEAELYRQSYIQALEIIKTPRRKFIMLQSQSLGLAHDAADVKEKIIAVEKELLNLKSMYNAGEQALFDSAHRDLIEMMQIQDPILFAAKKKQFLENLADIHQLANQRTQVEKNCEADIENVIEKGQSIFTARSCYLEDKNHWMNRASSITENSWTTMGVGLGAVAIVGVVGAVVMAPVTALTLGLVGAAYGAVDLGRSIGSTLGEEATTRLGERTVIKPQQSWKDKAKSFAKKALPIALCVAGVALGVAAIVATGGAAAIVLAVAGLAVSAVGVGKLVYDKYQERKELMEIQQQHKEINASFEKKNQELFRNKLADRVDESPKNSTIEEMNLLAGHSLTKDEIEKIKSAPILEDTEDKVNESTTKENSLKTSVNDETEEDEGEGGSESGNTEQSNDDDHIPTLKP